jgi:hypothetical protein
VIHAFSENNQAIGQYGPANVSLVVHLYHHQARL